MQRTVYSSRAVSKKDQLIVLPEQYRPKESLAYLDSLFQSRTCETKQIDSSTVVNGSTAAVLFQTAAGDQSVILYRSIISGNGFEQVVRRGCTGNQSIKVIVLFRS